MPYEDPDITDPMMFVGVTLPGNAEATQDMAYAFAEEFARMGYSAERILHLFRTPFYKGAHGAHKALGEASIRKIVNECVGVWGRVRYVTRDAGRVEGKLIPPESIRVESKGRIATCKLEHGGDTETVNPVPGWESEEGTVSEEGAI